MEEEIERYKKQIDEDFEIFIVNKRFIRIEKAWIRDISHQIMKKHKSFVHNDRKELRLKLFKYLNKKKKEADKRGIQ